MTPSSLKADRLPFDPGPAAWNRILPDRQRFAAAEGERSADVLIVGAGFAGLSAARRLKQLDPKLKIIVAEARDIAEGPAGRNSGFMIDLPHNLASAGYAGDRDKDCLQTAMNRQAIDFAGDAVAEYSMPDEAFARSGKVNAAATAKGMRQNREYARHLAALGEDCERLDARQMSELCGTNYYRNGLYTPGTALLQPALYIRGLAEGLAPDGVAICEQSPVLSLTRQGNTWLAQTPSATVSAGKVVMANNGHIESFGLFRRRLIHVYLFASMTRALDAGELARLGGEPRWGLTPSDPLGSTVRRISGTGGTRIVLRNGIKWAPGRTATAAAVEALRARHDRSLSARFPGLDAEPEYRWGGLLCLSLNGAPAFGEVETGLYAACCQNGLGTAFGTLSGMAVAELLAGQKSPRVAFMTGHAKPSRLPPEPLATIGAKLRFWHGERFAGAEI